MTEVIPVRQGHRDLLRLMAYLGGFLVAAMVGGSWLVAPEYDATRVALLCGCTGVFLLFPGFICWVSLWYLWHLRDGRLVLGDDGRLTYAWRTGSRTIDLAEVHTLRWWWPKFQNQWGEPIRLWTKRTSMSIDPKAFTVADRDRLTAWLRQHLPPAAKQVGQDEFAQVWAGTPRSPTDWPGRFPWLYGRRLVALLLGPTLLAAMLGIGCWAYLRFQYPGLGPVDVSGPHDGPFGRILLSTPAHWALFLAVPGFAQVGAILWLLRGTVWVERYTNRDAYGAP